MSARAREFRDRGFVVIPGLLEADEVEHATCVLERLSGRTRAGFDEFRVGGRWSASGRRGLYRGWTLPDGVCQTPELWRLAAKPALAETMREILGEETRFLQHNDLHVGFSALAWHRDCVTRRLSDHGDWDESREPYRLARVGFYLHRPEQSGFALGLVPRSHRRGGAVQDADLSRLDRRASPLAQAWSLMTRHDPLALRANWLTVTPGDAVVFDPRILHAGSRFSGPKYSFFVAFGAPGVHFARHQAYYRHVRAELHYAPLAAGLVERLREAGLLAEDLPAPEGLADGFVPGRLQSWLGRTVRPGTS
jgi:hypothetical protein